jgi:gas vesicle protein
MFHDSDHGDTRPFAAGLILGALIGAGVALLLAPQSGEETRRLLRRRAKKVAGAAQDRFDDLKDRVKAVRRRAEEALE